jgi:pilus assembly protein CpaC
MLQMTRKDRFMHAIRWGAAAIAAAVCLTAPVTTEQAMPQQAPSTAQRITMVAGRSIVMETQFDIERIAINDPTVADILVVQQRELLINGKKPGTVSLWIWGPGRRVEYELVVDPGITTLQQQFQTLFPGEDIQVSVSQGALMLSGRVSSNQIMLKAVEIASASSPQQRVINMLQLPGGEGSQQVMLQVRFAEVNSQAVRELGLSLFTTRSGFTARSTTQQFPAPVFDDEATEGVQGLVFADYLNLFFFQRNEGIGGVMRALQQNGWFESLAEPNLIAYNGQKASFLAGGEFPVIAATGNGAASVTFKEYGIRLEFTPTIAGDTIRLHVRPEVSNLDFANGVTSAGFRVPALTTRYAETDVELRDGQSFAIAGLLDHIGQEDKANIPFLSQLPIIGKLFQSKATREQKTELMVLITPRLVRPLNPDEVPPLPSIIRTPPAGGRGGRGGGGGTVAEHLRGGAGLVDAPIRGRSGGQ